MPNPGGFALLNGKLGRLECLLSETLIENATESPPRRTEGGLSSCCSRSYRFRRRRTNPRPAAAKAAIVPGSGTHTASTTISSTYSGPPIRTTSNG